MSEPTAQVSKVIEANGRRDLEGADHPQDHEVLFPGRRHLE
jgi:hypothetical protein